MASNCSGWHHDRNESNGGNVGGETGQNKHKQKVRGKKDRNNRPISPSPVHQDSMQICHASGVDKLYY